LLIGQNARTDLKASFGDHFCRRQEGHQKMTVRIDLVDQRHQVVIKTEHHRMVKPIEKVFDPAGFKQLEIDNHMSLVRC